MIIHFTKSMYEAILLMSTVVDWKKHNMCDSVLIHTHKDRLDFYVSDRGIGIRKTFEYAPKDGEDTGKSWELLSDDGKEYYNDERFILNKNVIEEFKKAKKLKVKEITVILTAPSTIVSYAGYEKTIDDKIDYSLIFPGIESIFDGAIYACLNNTSQKGFLNLSIQYHALFKIGKFCNTVKNPYSNIELFFDEHQIYIYGYLMTSYNKPDYEFVSTVVGICDDFKNHIIEYHKKLNNEN